MFRHVVLTSASVIALTAATNAADIFVPGPGPGGYKDGPYAYDWSGLYIGANGGYGWSDPTWAFPGGQFFTLAGPGTTSKFSNDLSGALGGGQIGINKQFGSVVLGVEATGDWARWKQTLIGPLGFPNDKWTTKLEDFETVTGRFGYAVNNWLFYGKAGLAYTKVTLSALSGPPVPGVVYGQSREQWGTDFGGGVEYALTRNIILGVEYNWIGFDHPPFNGLGFLGAASTPVTVSPTNVEVQSVVGRISYKFNMDYVPLK